MGSDKDSRGMASVTILCRPKAIAGAPRSTKQPRITRVASRTARRPDISNSPMRATVMTQRAIAMLPASAWLSRFSEEAEMPMAEVCRCHGISGATFYEYKPSSAGSRCRKRGGFVRSRTRMEAEETAGRGDAISLAFHF